MTPTIPEAAVQADKTLWCVNIKGPDDIISAPDHLSAVRMANTFNAWWLDLITKKPLTDNHPRMWAEPIEWPYSEGHGEDVTDPNNEYHWLRELTAALPFITGVTVKKLEWKQEDTSYWRASTSCGSYGVNKMDEGYFEMDGDIYADLEAAKAAAQADYAARILSAIEFVPSPREQALEEGDLRELLERLDDGLEYEGDLETENNHIELFNTEAALELFADAATAIRSLSQGTSSERAQALEEAAQNACMYLETGFIECPKCGEEVETKHTDAEYTLRSALSSQPVADGGIRKFKLGERLTKNKGSSWTGRVVGFYSTELTPIGYAIESETEKGSVQIYPEAALRPLPATPGASECPTCNGTGTEGKNSICRDCDETRPTGGSNHGE